MRWIGKFSTAIILIAAFGVMYYLISLQYPFHWNIVPFDYIKLYLMGMVITLEISIFYFLL